MTNVRARLMGEKKVRRKLEAERSAATALPPRTEEKEEAGPTAIAASGATRGVGLAQSPTVEFVARLNSVVIAQRRRCRS